MRGTAPPRPAPLRIGSLPELREAHRLLRRPSRLDPLTTFEFSLPQLPDAANRDLTASMNAYARDCGCFAGGLAMGASVLALLAQAALRGGPFPWEAWRTLASWGGLVLGSAVAGKLAGLAWARVRMVRLAATALVAAQLRSVHP